MDVAYFNWLEYERWMNDMYGLTYDYQGKCWIIEPRLNRKELPCCEHETEKEFMEYMKLRRNTFTIADDEDEDEDLGSDTETETHYDDTDCDETFDSLVEDCNRRLDHCYKLCTQINQIPME